MLSNEILHYNIYWFLLYWRLVLVEFLNNFRVNLTIVNSKMFTISSMKKAWINISSCSKFKPVKQCLNIFDLGWLEMIKLWHHHFNPAWLFFSNSFSCQVKLVKLWFFIFYRRIFFNFLILLWVILYWFDLVSVSDPHVNIVFKLWNS